MSNVESIKVSVIMPVYNSEQYVRHAAESVLCQDFDSFELLLMDDGSTDGSGLICDELAKEHDNVRVFHTENGGMCHARNLGMEHARGEYLAFCDNDDEYLAGLLSQNYAIAIRDNADCVRFGRNLEVIVDEGEQSFSSYGGPSKFANFKGEDIFAHYDLVREGTGAVWVGLYRRSLIREHNILFDESLRRGFEDLIFNYDVFDVAKSISINPRPYYVWRRRVSHSSSFVVDDNYYYGLEKMLLKEDALMRKRGVNERLPEFYANHLVAYLQLCIGASYYGKRPSYSELCSAFDRLHPFALEYCVELNRSLLTPANRLFLDLLLSKRYRLLSTCVRVAGRMKQAR